MEERGGEKGEAKMGEKARGGEERAKGGRKGGKEEKKKEGRGGGSERESVYMCVMCIRRGMHIACIEVKNARIVKV